jgi:diguanylate cyclase (GGDEF)-like protein
MQLDLPTLMVMQSFALACAGAVLLFAWFQNRMVSALAFWGFADIIAAAGILSLMIGLTLHQQAWLAIGGILLPLQSGMIWKAARIIDSKPAPLAFVVLGAVVVGLAGVVPDLQSVAGSLSLFAGALYSVATATTLWPDEEPLAARWPLIGLSGLQAAALLIGTYSTLIGSTSQDIVPSITSLFGFIYFESIIFALGTSVFVLALVKERNEAVSITAGRTDALTGIANRASFLESAGRVLERCRLDSAPVSVMMFDLDRFKAVNDGHGHAVGDAVIRKFCEIVTAALRPNDAFGRMGGEEFAVVLPGSSIESAYVRAERMRASFAASCRIAVNRQVDATVSCGLSVSQRSEQTLTALLEDADTALYCAKSEGRNRVKRADQSMPERGSSTVIRVA